MTKQHFIALANALRAHNQVAPGELGFGPAQLSVLADFCAAQNPRFDRTRWLDYIDGKCGLNGGAVKGGTK